MGNAADYVPKLTITPHSAITCRLPGRMVVTFEVVVISIFNGFDQILKFEFQSKSASVVCGIYTSSEPPPEGHYCTLCVLTSLLRLFEVVVVVAAAAGASVVASCGWRQRTVEVGTRVRCCTGPTPTYSRH